MLKKVLRQYLKNNFLLIILILIGLFFHFYYLNIFPVGLTHDDVDVVVSMKTLANSGNDVSGVSFPSLLFFNKTQGNISGLVSFLISPIFKIFDLNLFNIHFIYVIINIISILLISYLVFLLTKNERLPIYIFLIGLFNPWLFAYSRYPTEAPVALFFALAGLVFLFSKFKGSTLISSLFFIFSFYSYYGAKVIIILLFPILVYLFDIKNKILPLILFVLSVALYFLISVLNPNSTFSKRMGNEFIFKNIGKYQQMTDEFRKISIESGSKNLFFNKYVFAFEDVFKKYIGWLSPDVLFFEGDPVSVYRFSDHGLFYLIDILLFLGGIIYLILNSKKIKNLSILVILLLLLAPIGSSLSNIGTSYFFRSFLLLIPLLIILGLGMYFLKEILEKYNKKIIWYFFLIVYLIFFARFLTFYFIRYPVSSSENNFLSERVVSSYVSRIDKNRKVYLKIVNKESFVNLHYFYNDMLLENVSISSDCSLIDNQGLAIYSSVLECPDIQKEYLVIIDQKDSGARYKIFNDTLCSLSDLTPYKRSHKAEDYKIEQMSDKDFCNRWIQKQ